MPWTHTEVFKVFAKETGIDVRSPSDVQHRQAQSFSEQFTELELVLVVRWLKSQIRECEERGRDTFDRRSLQFRPFFAAEESAQRGKMSFPLFNDRLGLATEWAQKRAPSLLPSAKPEPVKKTQPSPVSDDERARLLALAEAEYDRNRIR